MATRPNSLLWGGSDDGLWDTKFWVVPLVRGRVLSIVQVYQPGRDVPERCDPSVQLEICILPSAFVALSLTQRE
jgi:hypothetical protein